MPISCGLVKSVCGTTIFITQQKQIGGVELLYGQMERLIKSKTVTSPADKEKEVRYNKDNNVCRVFITGGMNT